MQHADSGKTAPADHNAVFGAATVKMYLGLAALGLACLMAASVVRAPGADMGRLFQLVGCLALGYLCMLALSVPSALKSARLNADIPGIDTRSALVARLLVLAAVFFPLYLKYAFDHLL